MHEIKLESLHVHVHVTNTIEILYTLLFSPCVIFAPFHQQTTGNICHILNLFFTGVIKRKFLHILNLSSDDVGERGERGENKKGANK